MPSRTADMDVTDRLRRVAWNTAVRKTERGVPLLPVEFAVEQGRAVQLVDVRDEAELFGPLGHIPGTAWVPLAEVERITRDVDHSTLVLVVCNDGDRSLEAVLRLMAAGMEWVAALAGGLRAWKDRGYATTTNRDVLERRTIDAPVVPVLSGEQQPLTLDDIRAHIGDPRSVRWVKMAAMMLHGKTSCIDGRDDNGVVGTPGGDAGEFVLALSTIEAMTGQVLSDETVAQLLVRYVDAFGHFYLHTDITALNLFIASLRADPRIDESWLPARTAPAQAWRQFTAAPPQQVRPFLLEHLVAPDAIGCGHLKFMLTRSADYGVRSELVRAFFRAFFTMRWEGLTQLEYVPLGGRHREGAVCVVHLDEEVEPFTRIPLVSPTVNGVQMFVNHPDVTRYQRRLVSRFVCLHSGVGPRPADTDVYFGELSATARRQAGHTVGALAAGLPVFQVRFDINGEFTVT
ncbi:MAG: rhodanese-like domain-containing protein [Archangium sp.]|nr:rhodanese-like domain-containing protein [Archangium sp.]